MLYYIALPFIYLLSLTPFRLLYIISDGVYVLLYRVIGYRKELVWKNLTKSFPEKTDVEIELIRKQFYHHLCDVLLETFKTLTISEKEMLKRCSFSEEAQTLFDKLAEEGKSIILVMGHQGNWEWAGNSFSLLCKQQLYVIYHPLKDKKFNGLIVRMRGRFRTKLIAMKDTFRAMIANRKELNATAFIADQSPAPESAYWTQFLNQDTPVFPGTGKMAKKLNMPVVYACVSKVKRGYYTIYAEMLEEQPKEREEDEITELYTRRLEQDIRAQPETWIWSHNRWKHKRKI